MGLRLIRSLALALDEQTIEEIDDSLVRFFDSEECERIVSGLFTTPGFVRWRSRIEDGLSAHCRGEYASSIAVWFICIEGVVRDELGVGGVYQAVQRGKGYRVRVALESEHPSDALQDALIDVLRQAGLSWNPTKPPPVAPNRNVIMHGLDPDYPNERTSIQLVVMLEVLHHYVPLASAAREPVTNSPELAVTA